MSEEFWTGVKNAAWISLIMWAAIVWAAWEVMK